MRRLSKQAQQLSGSLRAKASERVACYPNVTSSSNRSSVPSLPASRAPANERQTQIKQTVTPVWPGVSRSCPLT
eukprot:scaffold3060_cov223-Alexandrium_tamarense.AAC.6